MALAEMFRFHTGSIKRPIIATLIGTLERCFDSILVRLKGLAKAMVIL